MATEIKKILVRRGLQSDTPTLSVGELGLQTDTGNLLVGTDAGNVEVSGIREEAITAGSNPGGFYLDDDTIAVTAFNGYSRIIATLYPDFTGSYSEGDYQGETISVYPDLQLTYNSRVGQNVCFDGEGGIIVGPTNESQCTIEGGTWLPDYDYGYGFAGFSMGGQLERHSETEYKFVAPNAVTGITWKLVIKGVK
jgi:hypothetical protein